MNWQNIIVFLCIIAASIYLLRRYTPFLLPKKFRAKADSCATACGGCSGDSASACTTESKQQNSSI